MGNNESDRDALLAQMQSAEIADAVSATQNFAKMTATYYKQLVEEGVPEALAGQALLTYTASFLHSAAYGGEEEE